MESSTSRSSNLGNVLLREGLISKDQYEEAMRDYGNSERPLSRILVDMGAISEGVKIGVMQKRCSCRLLPLNDLNPRADAIRLLPRRYCEKYHIVPLRVEGGHLHVAMEDPLDVRTINAVEAIVAMPVQPYLAKTADISNVIERLPEDDGESIPDAPKHGMLYRIFSALFLPVICGAPIVAFVLLLLYSNEFKRWWSGLEFTRFEQGLFFLLAWSAWAIVAYWIDDLIFKRESQET